MKHNFKEIYNDSLSKPEEFWKNISEDVLKDGYKSFENGLPTSSIIEDVDTASSVWGWVPKNFSIVDAFDNDPTSREYQDVGLDGLRSADEKIFFDSAYIQPLLSLYGSSSLAYMNAIDDPSGDNFHYFRGSDFDSQEISILDRYKDINNMDGNSVTTENSPESYPTAASSKPNTEDLNGDRVTYRAVRLPKFAKFDRRTATLEWTPRKNQDGVNDFILMAVDEHGATTVSYTHLTMPTILLV